MIRNCLIINVMFIQNDTLWVYNLDKVIKHLFFEEFICIDSNKIQQEIIVLIKVEITIKAVNRLLFINKMIFI